MLDAVSPLLVLTVNSGSSSLKLGLHRVDALDVDTLLRQQSTPADAQQALQSLRQFHAAILAADLPMPRAVGHRVVHGGPRLRQHQRLDAAVLRQLKAAVAFAPLHLPAALALMAATTTTFADLPQVACFDTTFHLGLPEIARTLPVDRTLQALGVQRYGFHGLSCESILQTLGEQVPPRLVIAHLGSGASITAVQQGQSVDTTMGFTPNGGVMMGTRSGDIDPGLWLYLLQEQHYAPEQLQELMQQHCGLLGVSGVSSDLRKLAAVSSSNSDAQLALAMFSQSIKKAIAAMAAVLGGLDLLVFTGGIGENTAALRAEACVGLQNLGITLDERFNHEHRAVISRAGSAATVRVMASEEDRQMARHVQRLV